MHHTIFIGRDNVSLHTYEHLRDPLEISIASSVPTEATLRILHIGAPARDAQSLTVAELREYLDRRDADMAAEVAQRKAGAPASEQEPASADAPPA